MQQWKVILVLVKLLYKTEYNLCDNFEALTRRSFDQTLIIRFLIVTAMLLDFRLTSHGHLKQVTTSNSRSLNQIGLRCLDLSLNNYHL